MKPEDFHIYKERAITGNPWLGMDMAAMTAELERWANRHKNDLDYLIMRALEEQAKTINPCFTLEREDYTRYIMLFPDLKVFRAAELVDGD